MNAHVRTYFWDSPNKYTDRQPSFLPKKKGVWRVGNAGDIYNRDLIRHLYGAEPENAVEQGRRLLLVGSTVHTVQAGDIVAGVGTKGAQQPPVDTRSIRVLGVRGPITAGLLTEAGYDTNGIQFMLDPGLLIAKVFPELTKIASEPNRVAFIPHYREAPRYRTTSAYDLIDVDSTPLEFAREIVRSEVVYSSSLHGVIFAHALGRPAVLVAPKTAEAEIKYRDYYASVGQDWRVPMGIDESLRSAKPTIPSGLDDLIESAKFPTFDELKDLGVAS